MGTRIQRRQQAGSFRSFLLGSRMPFILAIFQEAAKTKIRTHYVLPGHLSHGQTMVELEIQVTKM